MSKMKIRNLKDDSKILWKKIPCICKKGIVMESYPMVNCLNCRYQQCEDSIPRESFKIKDHKGKVKEITSITLVRGTHDDVMGWNMEAK
jgi:hypothetical protein